MAENFIPTLLTGYIFVFHQKYPTPPSLSFEHVDFCYMDSFPQSLADHKLKVSNRRKLIPKKV
jgi:hypothetical protein